MDPLSLLLIALALSMDAFAVSVAGGALVRHSRLRQGLTVALYFGGFQALMPVLGWLAGTAFQDLISAVDHWIAFALLCFIGARMIRESYALPGECRKGFCMEPAVLLTLAVATSIDALAVGLTFAMLGVRILVPVLIIGPVTFGVSLGGFLIGSRFGHFFERKVEALGGLILIGIGVKILVEHIV